MGTIAARDCLRIIELTEQVAAALLITVRQAIELRMGMDAEVKLSPVLADMHERLSTSIPFIAEDRALDKELRALLDEIRSDSWSLYEA